MPDRDLLTDEFEDHRAHLRAVAYRMLGSFTEADDAVQEAWLRLHRSDSKAVANLEAWLTTVVARVCLDMLRARKARREAYIGSWLPASAVSMGLGDDLRAAGATFGCGVVYALPGTACGVLETARVARYLAEETAGQCGPCVFGLAALADAFGSIAECDGSVDDALDRISRLHAQIARRGACAHPDGTLGLVRSALNVFASEVEAHRSGRCTATGHASVLPA